MRLQGKVAVVTGGAVGIGAAIASGLAREGAKVCVADISGAGAQAEASKLGPDAVGLEVDIANLESVKSMVEAVMDRYGRIDVLVNNAGVTRALPWLKVTAEEFDRIFAVNVRGLLFMTQAVVPHMIEGGGGSVINLTSGAGRRGSPVNVPYSASKAAVINLTQSAALAFASKGVRVNAISPGGVLTPMWRQADEEISAQRGQPKGSMAASFAQMVPLGRLGDPEDYVGIAVFLAGEESAYLTGQTISVDGGLWIG